MRQCNACGRPACKLFRRMKKEPTAPEAWQRDCNIHIPLKPFKSTLFELAVVRNSAGFVETMTKLGMRIESQSQYPFFKFVEV